MHSLAADGTILSANRAELDLLGYRHDEYVGHNSAEFHADPAAAAEMMARLRSGEILRDCETRIIARDGTIIDVLIDSSVLWRDGEWVRTRCFVRDNRAGKRAELALRSGERAYLRLLESLPASFVWAGDASGNVTYINQHFLDYSGLSREDVAAGRWTDAIHPDEREALATGWRQAVEADESGEAEHRVISREGVARWFLSRVVPLRDDDGVTTAWLATSTDIDDRRRAQEALQESERRFRQLADAMPQVVWAARPDGFVDYSNSRWQDFTGGATTGGGDGAWMPVLHPDDAPRALEAWYASVRSGQPYEVEYRFQDRATGQYRWYLTRALPVRDDAGQIVRWFGTSTDIEDIKRAEQALMDETRAVETLQGIGIALTQELDVHRVLQSVTDSATQLAGAQFGVFLYKPAEEADNGAPFYAISGVPREMFDRLPVPHDMACLGADFTERGSLRCDEAAARACFCAHPEHCDWPEDHLPARSYLAVPVVAPSGDILGGLFFGHPEQGRFGEREERLVAGIAGWAAVALDNARLFEAAQRTAEELKRANAAKDEFLGLVSHELKTPITTIYGNAEVLRRRMDRLDHASRLDALHDISNEAERLHRIIDNLLVLARLERGQQLNAEPLLVRRLIERIAAEHQRRHPNRPIEVVCDSEPTPILGEPVYVEQIMRNLLSNAEKYSSPGQPIRVQLAAVQDRIEVSVLDRGSGFPAEEADLLFTPFYRSPGTAAHAGGVGIGLAVCRRLVEAQGGQVWARPRPGGGADIGFSRPAAEDAP
ncbi:MAG: PAS domain S-box protein [Chloroflexi bacterium]|nr:PAS domain S-box protein [Chloroflexota bacterium]